VTVARRSPRSFQRSRHRVAGERSCGSYMECAEPLHLRYLAGAPTGSDAGRAKLASLAATSNGDVHVISTHLWSKLLTFPGGRFSTSDEDERARTPRSGRKLRIPLIAVRRPFKLSC